MAEVVQEWYSNFVAVDQEILFELILAANYMDIKPLLDLTCATVASMIKGKTPEEIRKHFNIKNDFTPEEEEQVRKENEWWASKKRVRGKRARSSSLRAWGSVTAKAMCCPGEVTSCHACSSR